MVDSDVSGRRHLGLVSAPDRALESGKQQSGAGLWAQTAAGFGVRLTKPINSSDQERRDLITFMRGR